MTRDQLLANFDNQAEQAKAVLKRRNVVYAKTDDALFNIKRLGYMGILTQIREKCNRLENMIEYGFTADNSEFVHDSCIDIMNYGFLFDCLTEKE